MDASYLYLAVLTAGSRDSAVGYPPGSASNSSAPGEQLFAAGLRGVVISATDLMTCRWLRAVSAWEGRA